jgi:hypothetical protein
LLIGDIVLCANGNGQYHDDRVELTMGLLWSKKTHSILLRAVTGVCVHMYNLAVSSLSGPGIYTVSAVINGTPATGAATFALK